MELNDLLEEAKKRYPIGTKFKVVHSPNIIATVKNHNQYEFVKHNLINFFTVEKYNECEGASVYDNGNWAEIVSQPSIKIENTNYLSKFLKKLNIN